MFVKKVENAKKQKSLKKYLTNREKGVIILQKLNETLKIKQNFRSHHTIRVRMVNTFFPHARGVVCVRRFSVCIFLLPEVQNY